jgi:hypothetical protein
MLTFDFPSPFKFEDGIGETSIIGKASKRIQELDQSIDEDRE